MTTTVLGVCAIVAVLTLPSLALIAWDRRRARFTLTDAGEQAAARAVAGGNSVIVWDNQEHAYVRATRHPSGAVFIEVLDEGKVADVLAREAGVA